MVRHWFKPHGEGTLSEQQYSDPLAGKRLLGNAEKRKLRSRS
jgi:hypothetical protein